MTPPLARSCSTSSFLSSLPFSPLSTLFLLSLLTCFTFHPPSPLAVEHRTYTLSTAFHSITCPIFGRVPIWNTPLSCPRLTKDDSYLISNGRPIFASSLTCNLLRLLLRQLTPYATGHYFTLSRQQLTLVVHISLTSTNSPSHILIFGRPGGRRISIVA